MNKVITISREFGSGGRELGLWIAQKLEIPFYDKEMISSVDNSTLSAEMIEKFEESVQVQTIWGAGQNLFSFYQQSITDQIYIQQCEVIRKLAEKGPSVMVGRCADHVLQDSVNIFVYADLKARIQRKLDLGISSDRKELEQRIKEIDKKRRRYYEYYTDHTWGDVHNYHLCIDTTHNSLENCADTIILFAEKFVR